MKQRRDSWMRGLEKLVFLLVFLLRVSGLTELFDNQWLIKLDWCEVLPHEMEGRSPRRGREYLI